MRPGCQQQKQCSPVHAMRDTDIRVRVLSRNINAKFIGDRDQWLHFPYALPHHVHDTIYGWLQIQYSVNRAAYADLHCQGSLQDITQADQPLILRCVIQVQLPHHSRMVARPARIMGGCVTLQSTTARTIMLNCTLVQGSLDVANFGTKAVRFTLISANIPHVTCKHSNKSVNISWFDIHTNIIWPTTVRNRLHPYLG